MKIVSDVIIYIGIAFILFGIIGIIRFKDFYMRISIATKIDTVGAITVIFGLAVKHGFSFFTLKLMLLVCLIMIVNPLSSHMIARSAYLSGYRDKSKPAADTDEYHEDHV